MISKRIRAGIVAVLLAWPIVLSAQFSNRSVELSIGMNSYLGDFIERSGNWWNPTSELGKLNIGIGYHFYLDERTAFNAHIHIGSVEGSYGFESDMDPGVYNEVPELNDYFKSSFQAVETTLNYTLAQWNIADWYAGVGIGFLFYDIEDEDGRNLRLLENSRLPNETYETQTVYMPLKTGFIFFQDAELSLTYEMSWNVLNTDYIDNIGKLGNNENDMICRQSLVVRYHF